MGNYKPWGHNWVGSPPLVKSITQEPIVLMHFFNASAALKSLESDFTTNYQVPTGKNFIAVSISVYCVTGVAFGTLNLIEGDAADSGAGTNVAMLYTVDSVLSTPINTYPLNITFAAGKFVTVNPSTTQIIGVSLVGYEVSA